MPIVANITRIFILKEEGFLKARIIIIIISGGGCNGGREGKIGYTSFSGRKIKPELAN